MGPPRKPKLNARNTEVLRLYSTDDPRHLCHAAKGDDALIRLRDGSITREEVEAEILWRVWRERVGYCLLLLVSVIGAIAAVSAASAAIEGWRWIW